MGMVGGLTNQSSAIIISILKEKSTDEAVGSFFLPYHTFTVGNDKIHFPK